jgi:UDP-N-acetylglucosamine acyltransferase
MNQIHPTAVIGPDVKIGTGNTVGPYAVILGITEIGNDNWIGPHVVIGTPGEMRGGEHPVLWDGSGNDATVRIGDRNIIREFTTVQSGAIVGTKIGDDCYIMTKSHIPHDGVLGNGVTISCSVMIGGHSTVLDGANVGLGAVVHQRLVIGERAMVGMGSVVTKNVPPYATAFGNPAVVRNSNKVGMERAGLSPELISEVSAAISTGDVGRLSSLVPEKMADFDSAIAVVKGSH